MAGYNRTRFVEELLERTEASPPSFTIHLHSEYWTLNQGSKFLYNNQIASLLDDIRAHRIPVDFLDLFEAAKVPFYDGCMIVELLDYRPQRGKEHLPEKPERTRVVLHPNSETLWADICSLNQRAGGKWTDRDALAIEAKLLLAISPPLCLDPDPHLTRMANHVVRVSTPTVPVSLKRKAAAMIPEEDETDKARRAKIMQFMTPQAPRIHTPSYRILDALQNARQASTKSTTPLPPQTQTQFINTSAPPPPQSMPQRSPIKPPTPAQAQVQTFTHIHPAHPDAHTHAHSPIDTDDKKDGIKTKSETPKITFAAPAFAARPSSQTPAPQQPNHFGVGHLQVPNGIATPSPNAHTRSPMPSQIYPSPQAQASDPTKRTPTPAQRQKFSQSPRPPSSQSHSHPTTSQQQPQPTPVFQTNSNTGAISNQAQPQTQTQYLPTGQPPPPTATATTTTPTAQPRTVAPKPPTGVPHPSMVGMGMNMHPNMAMVNAQMGGMGGLNMTGMGVNGMGGLHNGFSTAQLYAQQRQAAAYLQMKNGRVTPQAGAGGGQGQAQAQGQGQGQPPPPSAVAVSAGVGRGGSPMVGNRPIAARSPMPQNAQSPQSTPQGQPAQPQQPGQPGTIQGQGQGGVGGGQQNKHPPQHPQAVFTPSYNPAHLRPMIHGNPGAQQFVQGAGGSNASGASNASTAGAGAGGAQDGQQGQGGGAQGGQPQQMQYNPAMYGYPGVNVNFGPMGVQGVRGGMNPAMTGYWQMGMGMGRGMVGMGGQGKAGTGAPR